MVILPRHDNPSTGETEAGRLCASRLYSKTLLQEKKKVVFPPNYAESSLGARKHQGRQEIIVAEAPGQAKGEAQEDPGSQWQGPKGCSCTKHAQSDTLRGPSFLHTFCEPCRLSFCELSLLSVLWWGQSAVSMACGRGSEQAWMGK